MPKLLRTPYAQYVATAVRQVSPPAQPPSFGQVCVVVTLQYGTNGLPGAALPSCCTRKMTPVSSGALPPALFWSWPPRLRSPITT